MNTIKDFKSRYIGNCIDLSKKLKDWFSHFTIKYAFLIDEVKSSEESKDKMEMTTEELLQTFLTKFSQETDIPLLRAYKIYDTSIHLEDDPLTMIEYHKVVLFCENMCLEKKGSRFRHELK